jgi:hypothetical protein
VYTFNGQTISASGTYTDTLINALGCDSLVTLNLTVHQPSAYAFAETICAPAVYTFNGQAITASGTYTDILINALGCDSLVTLNLTVHQPSAYAFAETICAPAVYTFNGQTISASGTYSDTLINALGCDSVVNLDLLVNQHPDVTFSLNQTVTFGSQVGGHRINVCNNYNHVFVLDSLLGGRFPLITARRFWNGEIGLGTSSSIMLDTVYATGDTVFLIPSDSLQVGIYGLEILAISDANGCSVDFINGELNFTFNISSPSYYRILDTVCLPNTYNFFGRALNTTGVYSEFLTNSLGCDSVVILELFVNAIPEFSVTVNGLSVFGLQSGISGNRFSTCSNVQNFISLGAVSVGRLPFTGTIRVWEGEIGIGIVDSNYTINLLNIGDLIYFAPPNGLNSGIIGVELLSIVDANGCLANLSGNVGEFTFIVNEPSNSVLFDTICASNSYNFFGQNINSSGLYTTTIPSYFGCDSTITLSLFINDVPDLSISINGIVNDTSNNEIKLCETSNLEINIYQILAGVSPFQLTWGLYNDSGIILTGYPVQSDNIYEGDVLFSQPVNLTPGRYFFRILSVIDGNGCAIPMQHLSPNFNFHILINSMPELNFELNGNSITGNNVFLGFCSDERMTMRLSQIIQGIAPFAVSWDVFVDGSTNPDSLLSGSIFGLREGDAVFDFHHVLTEGNYRVKFKSISDSLGCSILPSVLSQIYTVEFDVNPLNTTIVYDTICHPDVLNFNGLLLSNSGVFQAVYNNVSGCDSLVELRLFVRRFDVTIIDPGVICIGTDSVELQSYTSGGIFTGQGVIGNYLYPALAGVGSHLINYSYTDNFGCSFTSYIFITIYPSVFSIGGDSIEVCPSEPAYLTAAGYGVVRYEWSTGDTTSGIVVRPSVNSIYTVRLYNLAGCFIVDTFVVLVLPSITLTVSNDIAICEGDSVVLFASGANIYYWTPSNGFSNQILSSYLVRPLVTTTYVVAGISQNGCVFWDSVTVFVRQKPLLTLANTSVTYCGQSTGAQLEASGGVTYLWQPASGLDDPTSATPVASPLFTTVYTVIITDSFGCSNSGNVTVVVPRVFSSRTLIVCSGDSVQLGLAYTGLCGQCQYLWTPSTGLDNPNISNPIAFTNTSLIYTVRVTDASGCESFSNVRIIVTPRPHVNAGQDVRIRLGDSVMLLGSVTGANYFSWSPMGNMNMNNILNPTVSPTNTTVYVLTAYNTNGCVETDSVLVEVDSLPIGAYVSGRVLYDRPTGSNPNPVSSGFVRLVDVTNISLDSSVAIETNGNYSFGVVPNASYLLSADVFMSPGGISAADAFLVNDYLSNPNLLTGLPALAADANADNVVNAADALLLLQRSISFPSAVIPYPWISETNLILANDNQITKDVMVISRGDVNRDFSFLARLSQNMDIIEVDKLVNAGEPIYSLPLALTQDLALTSLQMHVRFPDGRVVKEIRFSPTGERVMFHQTGNEVRLAWYSQSGPISVYKDNVLLEFVSNSDFLGLISPIQIAGNSVVTDFDVRPIPNVLLSVPSLRKGSFGNLDVQIYPVPISELFYLSAFLPFSGNLSLVIYDQMAREVHRKNYYNIQMGEWMEDLTDLKFADGMYTLRLELLGSGKSATVSRKFVVSR